jgi:hypothetical protein
MTVGAPGHSVVLRADPDRHHQSFLLRLGGGDAVAEFAGFDQER